MSIQDTSKGALLTALSLKAGVTITSAQLNVSPPKPTVDGESARNTKTKVYSGDPAVFEGGRLIYFDRLRFEDLANFTFVKQMAAAGLKLYENFSVVRNQTGIRLTEDDVENTTIEDDGEGNLSVLLKAKPGSIAWTGEFRLALANYPHISTAFSGNTLNGF